MSDHIPLPGLVSGRNRVASLLALALGMLLQPATADAQYFGRNQVQYRTFDVQVLETEHFDVHYYPEFEGPARDAAAMLERWYARMSPLLGHTFDRKPVILYANHSHFQQTNLYQGEIDQSTGGFTEGLLTRVVLPLTGVSADDDHVLGHELVHAFQYDISGARQGSGLQGMNQLPLWVIEGMAEYLSVGPEDPHTSMWMRDALLRDDIPTMRQLGRDPRYFPYRYGQAAWSYLGQRWGDQIVPDLFRAALRIGWDPAIRSMTGMTSDSLSAQWHAAIRAHYLPLMAGRTAPDSVGQRVIYQTDRAMNVSPVVSPDGQHLAFFSRRGIFSTELYVADAATGEITSTLASPTESPHFDAVSFISSAGAWSPDSRRFAFIVFAEGRTEINIMDVASREVQRRIRPAEASAITGVSWSPDGTRLAFSGIQGGQSDLFIVDIESGRVEQLTNDRYSAIHPAWSPDGKTIAFSTDRGPGTDLTQLAFGPMRIALIDAGTRQVRTLDLFQTAKHINPQFTANGDQLYFVSDQDGFSDIYRVTLATNEIHRVTRVATGVSGITYLSPAMSVAQETGRVVFSVFANGGNNIYGIAGDAALGTLVVPAPVADPEPTDATPRTEVSAGTLPPLRSTANIVSSYLDDHTTGLPATRAFASRPYKSRFGLEAIGQPTIGIAASSYGVAFGGSLSAFWGDLLGHRRISAALQGQGELADIGGQVAYVNAERRWNWGVSAGHIPYLSSFTDVRAVTYTDNQPARLIEQFQRRTFIDEVGGELHYPFSRLRRAEIGLKATRVGYSTRVLEVVERNGRILQEGVRDTTSPPAVTFGTATAAFVGDNTFFGFTSPVQGMRYRFEASPTIGGLSFVGALADARRYFFWHPFTLAVRGFHFGRYGGGGDDERLSPLFLGQGQLVRGYDSGSWSLAECTPAAAENSCPEFDRLVGTRMALASMELRIPLIGTRELGLIDWNFLPIEIAPFVDAGVAWTGSEAPQFRYDRNTQDRVPVVSTGITSRINLMGYLIVEAYYVRPLHRPLRGGYFGFQMAPGW